MTKSVIFYVHGGGLVAGGPKAYFGLLCWISNHLDKTIFFTDYRVAPENPLPEPLFDVLSSYKEVLDSHSKVNHCDFWWKFKISHFLQSMSQNAEEQKFIIDLLKIATIRFFWCVFCKECYLDGWFSRCIFINSFITEMLNDTKNLTPKEWTQDIKVPIVTKYWIISAGPSCPVWNSRNPFVAFKYFLV